MILMSNLQQLALVAVVALFASAASTGMVGTIVLWILKSEAKNLITALQDAQQPTAIGIPPLPQAVPPPPMSAVMAKAYSRRNVILPPQSCCAACGHEWGFHLLDGCEESEGTDEKHCGCERAQWVCRSFTCDGCGKAVDVSDPSECLDRAIKAGWRQVTKGGISCPECVKRANAA